MNQAFVDEVQVYVARYSVSASATRGQGAGVVAAARAHLDTLPLCEFGTRSTSLFAARLDVHTAKLTGALPRGARSWGLARKLLNIFLRNSFYTTYLCDHYRLHLAESLLELPLDSIVGKRLFEQAPNLPRWPGVKRLRPRVSFAYQSVARNVATTRGLSPVHLDVVWWGGPR